MNVGEYFVKLGINMGDAPSTLGKFASSLAGINIATMVGVTGLALLGNAIRKNIFATMDMAVEMRQFHNVSGLSLDTFRKWDAAARGAGVSASAVVGNIAQLSQSLAMLHSLGGDTKGWQLLGISVEGTTEQHVAALREVMLQARKTGREALVSGIMASQLGLSQEFIGMLGASDKEFAKWQKAGMKFEPNKQQLQDAEELRLKIVSLTAAFRAFSNAVLAVGWKPATMFLDALTGVLKLLSANIPGGSLGALLALLGAGLIAPEALSGAGLTAVGAIGALLGADLFDKIKKGQKGTGQYSDPSGFSKAISSILQGKTTWASGLGGFPMPAFAGGGGTFTVNQNFHFGGAVDSKTLDSVTQSAASGVRQVQKERSTAQGNVNKLQTAAQR